ncbi:PREDICTED: caspase-7-like [Branchiostoma belcheri]|uniref:Caspase-7-like n=1 Tax=Branchiostoma belcheri TaxID=7741 RepID=A0A6P5AKF3_BRABE|nr:PREDICTED: caspase-7-like [Branchiostoma belcheri]
MEDAHRSLHRQLFETINKEMDDDDFRQFRSIAQGKGLRPGEASKCNTPSDVLDKLQRKGKIKLGCYQALKDIFTEMDQQGLIDLVTETETKLEERGCEISDEIPQPYDSLKRQGSHPVESEAAKRRRSWGQTSSSSLDSNPSFERQISPTGERRRGSSTYQQSMVSFDSSVSPRHPLRRQSSSRSLPRSPQSSFELEDNDATRDPVILEDREDCYKPGKGFVLIMNNFSTEREASKMDVEGLEDFFQKIGYKVITADEDQTKEQMMDVLEMAKLEIQKTARGKNKYSCFICIVSSHGDKEGVKSYDNQTVSIAELQAPFLGDSLKCMAGSPKMFIIQACRGEKKQPGVDRPDEEPGDERQLDWSDVMRSVTTPKDADVLVAYATTEGFQAFRRVGEGSWFLSKMLKVFNAKHQTDHLLDMLTEVNDRVSHRTAIGSQPAKQMPCQVSTFTRKFFF